MKTRAGAERTLQGPTGLTPDRLLELGEQCRERIYTHCLRILRHPQDAEDAAQEVLLELLGAARAARDIQDPERWIATVSIHTALDLRKGRQRRLRHEHSPACAGRPAQDLSTPREELSVALEALDPAPRRLLERYFLEGCSLEQVARLEKSSTTSVWRLLERSKAALRKLLESSCLPALARGFGRARKVAEQARAMGAPGSTLPVPIRGEFIMAAKGVSTAGIVAVSILFFLLGGGAGLLIGASRGTPHVPTEARRATEPGALIGRGSPRVAKDSASPGLEEPRVPAAAAAPEEPLPERLRRFRDLLRLARNSEGSDWLRYYGKIRDDSLALRPAILAHPAEYLAFLRLPENDDVVDELVNVAFVNYRWSVENGQVTSVYEPPPDAPGREIQDAMREFLATGTSRQKYAALSSLPARDSQGKPDPVLITRCLEILGTEKGSALLQMALGHLTNDAQETLGDHVGLFANLLDRCKGMDPQGDPQDQNGGNYLLLHQCLNALSLAETANADRVLLENFKDAVENRREEWIRAFAEGMSYPRLTPSDEEPVASLLSRSFANTADPRTFKCLLELSLALPFDKADPVLGSAIALAPTPELKAGIQEAQDRIRKGDRSLTRLRNALEGTRDP